MRLACAVSSAQTLGRTFATLENMRNYLKEEEFVGRFSSWSSAVSRAVNEAWRPNPDCDDAERKQHEYFKKSGQMTWLVFSSASVHNSPNEETHAQVLLESSTRIVNVRVTTRDGKSHTEVLLDRAK